VKSFDQRGEKPQTTKGVKSRRQAGNGRAARQHVRNKISKGVPAGKSLKRARNNEWGFSRNGGERTKRLQETTSSLGMRDASVYKEKEQSESESLILPLDAFTKAIKAKDTILTKDEL